MRGSSAGTMPASARALQPEEDDDSAPTSPSSASTNCVLKPPPCCRACASMRLHWRHLSNGLPRSRAGTKLNLSCANKVRLTLTWCVGAKLCHISIVSHYRERLTVWQQEF